MRSVADELLKLAELRASGVLTEEEFSAQKKRLLAYSSPTTNPPPEPVDLDMVDGVEVPSASEEVADPAQPQACPNGHPVSDGAVICGQCGVSVKNPIDQSDSPIGSSSEEALSGTSGRKNLLRQPWFWLACSAVVAIVIIAVVVFEGNSKAPKHAAADTATTTTVPPTTVPPTTVPLTASQWLVQYGGIFPALLNDLAAFNTGLHLTGSETGPGQVEAECQQLKSDVTKAESYPTNPTSSAATAFSNMLNQDLMGTSGVQDSPVVNAGTLASAPQACLSDPDPLDTVGKQSLNDHIFVIGNSAPALVQAAQQAAQAAAPGVGLPPTATTTSTTAPPVATLSAIGTGLASIVVEGVSGGSTSSQQSLPWSETLPVSQGPFSISVATLDGSATTSISCEISDPPAPPVTQSASGPDANVLCSG
jgi:hypothetical protein